MTGSCGFVAHTHSCTGGTLSYFVDSLTIVSGTSFAGKLCEL